MLRHPSVLIVAFACVLAVTACGGGDDGAATTTTTPPTSAVTTSTTAPPTSAPPSDGERAEIVVVEELVYLTDDEGDWTLRVAHPGEVGPWPLIVVIPPQIPSSSVAQRLAERGAVVVQGDAWAPNAAWTTDPNPHLYGAMDRAACIVSWAQAHAGEYGGDPATTTVAGYSGGAMAAAWVGLGVADDSGCAEPIAHLPVALVFGESQFLFHHARWDPAFASGDTEPRETLDGLLNPQSWTVSPELRVGLWSAANPIGETRSIENPPAPDSWIWLRDSATSVVDDLAIVGAFEDERIDWHDNALLMESRLKSAGIDVSNEVYDIGHAYTDEVYDLIFSVQPTGS